jgi:diguanylate cyclase (GGDEF)-like protein
MVGVPRRYDFIGRYGGEEFLILVPGCDLPSAALVADRIREAVAAGTIKGGEIELRVTVSVGVASTSSGHTTSGGLLQAADEALYRAKAAGRNRVEA